MRLPYCLVAFFIACYAFPSAAAIVRGTVTDTLGEPIPYVSVYVKNSSYGASCDAEGTYFLELPAGSHTLVFTFLGYDKKEVDITLKQGQSLTVDVSLQPSSTEMDEVVLTT